MSELNKIQILTDLSKWVWDDKYRLKSSVKFVSEHSINDTWRRVGQALATPENEPDHWAPVFEEAMRNFCFIPSGRILSGAGTSRNITLANCFVMGKIGDSIEEIFQALGQAAQTIKAGGGIGYDFSTIRPMGAPVKGTNTFASGPVSFMEVWDSMCRTMQVGGLRRGAMMAVLSCDHPDIEAFVSAKNNHHHSLSAFNLSVLVSDAFMKAVKQGSEWPLIFKEKEYGKVPARDLWEKIMLATYENAEPGVIFIDRINELNNLAYTEEISATNPCGEQPLPPYGACILGALNLAVLVENPFCNNAMIPEGTIEKLTATAIRMLDNAIDVSSYPLPQQASEARQKRRIGLGITGLADALAMCGLKYGSPDAVRATENWLKRMAEAAYTTSAALAKEKGPFPLFDMKAFEEAPILRQLSPETRQAVREHGLRNGLLTSIAPTGTTSLLAGNVSSGIEPIFALQYHRRIQKGKVMHKSEMVVDYAAAKFQRLFRDSPLPETFVTVADLSPKDHITMMSAAQKWIDGAISKTINVPTEIPFEDFRNVYELSYAYDCKGCTTYRPNDTRESVLVKHPSPNDQLSDIVCVMQDTDAPTICHHCE